MADKFALASGLMEITYDSGAKVILQGPVTYEVESAAGGFLSLGKLTARVKVEENRVDEKPDNRETASYSPLFTIHIRYPLFTISTPTATVTDLGTEFGVEVAKSGNTTSHVFRGVVQYRSLRPMARREANPRVLHENESARVESRRRSRHRLWSISTARPPAFVREIPKRTIKTFDLVDVVAGGDGFSGRRNRGIDPTSGRIVDTMWYPDEDQLRRWRRRAIPSGRGNAVCRRRVHSRRRQEQRAGRFRRSPLRRVPRH